MRSKIIALLEKISLAGCEIPSETDGEISCHYCHQWIRLGQEHLSDCAFIEVHNVLTDLKSDMGEHLLKQE